jgi:hypothetical protein
LIFRKAGSAAAEHRTNDIFAHNHRRTNRDDEIVLSYMPDSLNHPQG